MKKYEKNYITEAIIRLDFVNPIKEVSNKLETEVSKKLKGLFAIMETAPFSTIKNVSQNNSINFENEEYSLWKFKDIEREKGIELSEKYLIVSFKKYDNFNNLKDKLLQAYEIVKNKYDLQVGRIGVRYVNQIEIEEGGLFDWEKYINKKLIENISFETGKRIRILSQIVSMIDDFTVNFRYGMYNTDYPAPIKKKQFILDCDCYKKDILDSKEEIEEFIDTAHNKIKEIFEKSIEDGLRKEMGVNE